MPVTNESEEFITINEDVQNGFFFLESRKFVGPFSNKVEASQEALKSCVASACNNDSAFNSCRAIYFGSVRINREINLHEPMSDMRQIDTVELTAVQATA